MKQILIDSITPNKNVGSQAKTSIFTFWLILTMGVWFFSGSHLLPTPIAIGSSLADLVEKNDFIRELITSSMFAIKSMVYASIISLVLAYAYVLPIFRPIIAFVAKARFLSTAGLTFFMAEITSDTAHQKVALLVFAITVFMVTSMLSIVVSTTQEELDYARTLRMNEWKATWHVIIRGKADQMFEVIRQNFAIAWMMLAMVETLCRADGGIGILLADSNKHFKLSEVFAIQFVVLGVGVLFDATLTFLRKKIFPYSILKLERK